MQFVRLVAKARKWGYSDFESKGRRFEPCWVHHIGSSLRVEGGFMHS